MANFSYIPKVFYAIFFAGLIVVSPSIHLEKGVISFEKPIARATELAPQEPQCYGEASGCLVNPCPPGVYCINQNPCPTGVYCINNPCPINYYDNSINDYGYCPPSQPCQSYDQPYFDSAMPINDCYQDNVMQTIIPITNEKTTAVTLYGLGYATSNTTPNAQSKNSYTPISTYPQYYWEQNPSY